MVNFAHAKVYKIIPCDKSIDECYVGSSTREYIKVRFSEHITAYRSWKAGTGKNYYSSFVLFEKYGVENCTFTIIEECDVKCKTELLQREQYYIKSLNCVNKINAHTTEEEARAQEKEYRSTPAVKAAKKAYREAQKPKEIRTLDPVTGVVRVQIFANKKRNLPKKTE